MTEQSVSSSASGEAVASSTSATAAVEGVVGPGTGQFYVIQNLLPGELGGQDWVLDVYGDFPEPGNKLITWPRGDSAINRQWQFIPAEPGWWYLQTRMDTNYVVTIDGDVPSSEAPIVMLPKDAVDHQRQLWSLVPSEQLGYWYIKSRTVVANDLDAVVIGVSGDDPGPATDVVTNSLRYVGFESQAWGFSPIR